MKFGRLNGTPGGEFTWSKSRRSPSSDAPGSITAAKEPFDDASTLKSPPGPPSGTKSAKSPPMRIAPVMRNSPLTGAAEAIATQTNARNVRRNTQTDFDLIKAFLRKCDYG